MADVFDNSFLLVQSFVVLFWVYDRIFHFFDVAFMLRLFTIDKLWDVHPFVVVIVGCMDLGDGIVVGKSS